MLPNAFSAVFPFEVFNCVQSKCFNMIYESEDNVVVSAPTGSGKTVLLELAICKLVKQQDRENSKVIYLAPTKALCKEKADQWRTTFSATSLGISELTGDTSKAGMKSVREAKVIVTTPEKWDSITRNWGDHRKLLDLVDLFLIDEVHILKESRGATLEAIVSRMKTYGSNVRFLALSATVPNSEDIASWLGRNHADPHSPARTEVFGEEYRPVKLDKKVYGIESKLNDHAFDSYLNSQLWKYIEKHAQNKPMLVFCMTRKSCREAAGQLAKEWSHRHQSARPWPGPKKRIPVIDADLQDLVRYGVAFHHAGLDIEDRKVVHSAFLEGDLSIICCTSTLAVGVNLPCHTVLLKGTMCYQDGKLCPYNDLEVMQMLGRAGRPQYGNSGVAIILTRPQQKKRYEELGSGQQVLESTLHKNLIEHLNSEISLGTFKDSQGAKKWLQGTFLSVRLQHNPEFYSDLTAGHSACSPQDQLQQASEAAISSLRDARLLAGQDTFSPTDYGRAMSKYMIRFDTMKHILKIPRGSNKQDLVGSLRKLFGALANMYQLNALCQAAEFSDIRWQANERDIFREVNNDAFIMYPVEKNVTTIPHKISLLIQMELGHVEVKITGPERTRLRAEASRVLEVMHRLIRAVIECKGSDMDGAACWAALELARSMKAKAWEGKAMQLFQVAQVGPVLMRKLVSNNINTVASLGNTDAVTIERIASRNPPFGTKMVASLASFPRLKMRAMVKGNRLNAEGNSCLEVDAVLGFTNKGGRWQGKTPLVTFMAMSRNGVMVYFWRESLNAFGKEGSNSCKLFFTWSPEDFQESLICRFACEEIVGTVVATEVTHSLPASKFASRSTEPSSRIDERNVCDRRSPSAGLDYVDNIDDYDLADLMTDSPQTRNEASDDEAVDDEDLFQLIDQDGNFIEDPPKSSTASSKALSTERRDVAVAERQHRLPNGRYKCGHSCSRASGGRRADGADCGHECCRNGSKRPPRASRKDGGQGTKKLSNSQDSKASPADPQRKAQLETRASSAGATGSSSNSRHQPPRPSFQATMDLSAYDVDEDGILDLTVDDELPWSYVPVDGTCSGEPQTRVNGGRETQTTCMEEDTNVDLESLSDDDLVGVLDDLFSCQTHKVLGLPKKDGCHVHDKMEYLSPALELSDTQNDETHAQSRNENDDPRKLSAGAPGSTLQMRESVSTKLAPASDLVKSTDFDEIVSDKTIVNGTDGYDEVFEYLVNNCDQARSASCSRSPGREWREELERPAEGPHWLEDFDPDLIDQFRDAVDFV